MCVNGLEHDVFVWVSHLQKGFPFIPTCLVTCCLCTCTFVSRIDIRHVTNWQTRSIDKELFCHCFLSLSLYLLHFVYDLTCSSSSFVAVFEKSVLQMYRQMHTQTDCCILLIHNHECKAYLAASMVEMSLRSPWHSCSHIKLLFMPWTT